MSGKYDLIKLYRRIIYQNDHYAMKNWLKPPPETISINLKKTTKGQQFLKRNPF